jgi:hypothetical protein
MWANPLDAPAPSTTATRAGFGGGCSTSFGAQDAREMHARISRMLNNFFCIFIFGLFSQDIISVIFRFIQTWIKEYEK